MHKQSIEVVVASSRHRYLEASNWVAIDESMHHDSIKELMQFRAVSVMLAQAFIYAHGGRLHLDVTNMYDPVYKLNLKVVASN